MDAELECRGFPRIRSQCTGIPWNALLILIKLVTRRARYSGSLK